MNFSDSLQTFTICSTSPVDFFAVHGDPAAVAEEPANRKAEYLRLAHETDVCPQAEDHAQEQEEVPVGGVRRADQDEFRDVGEFSIHAPAALPHDEVVSPPHSLSPQGQKRNRARTRLYYPMTGAFDT
jgi:hypothetical protein